MQKSGIKLRKLRIAVFLIALAVISVYVFSACSKEAEPKKETEQPTIQSPTEIAQKMAEEMQGADFSTFKHDGPQHGKLPCLLCHQPTADSPKPKLSGHIPCASCHVQQFEDKNNAMCTICHTAPGSSEVKDFPPIKSFNIQFNHQEHFKQADCATCHKSEGAGMTIPSGGDAHATCYQCHTADKVMGEKNLGSCSTCHQPGTPTQIADSTKAPGFGFDHNRHSGLSCTSCHNSTGGNNMSAPTVAMHTSAGSAQSCATCHNGSRAFGANTFANCKSCHQQFAGARSFGVKFEHSDHAKANCATCHKSAGKGVSFSVPAGQNAHTTCFQCHSPTKQGTSQNNGYCFQCHQPGSGERMAAAPMFIAGNFSHTKHKAMACNSCHSTKGGDISAPTVAMHKTAKGTQSCATCHNNQKAFGEDFSNCKRCHTGENFKFTGK